MRKFANVFVLFFKDALPHNFYISDDIISIHKYEQYVLTIHNLTIVLQSLPGTDIVKIVDGNKNYSEIEMWQIDPKPDFIISVDEFYKKYGKLKNSNIDMFSEFNCISINDFEIDELGNVERKNHAEV